MRLLLIIWTNMIRFEINLGAKHPHETHGGSWAALWVGKRRATTAELGTWDKVRVWEDFQGFACMTSEGSNSTRPIGPGRIMREMTRIKRKRPVWAKQPTHSFLNTWNKWTYLNISNKLEPLCMASSIMVCDLTSSETPTELERDSGYKWRADKKSRMSLWMKNKGAELPRHF